MGFTEEEGKFSSASWETQALEIQPYLQSEGRHGPIPRKPPLEGDRDLFLDSPSLKEIVIARCSGSSSLKETHSRTPVFREFLLDKQMLCIPCFLFPGHFFLPALFSSFLKVSIPQKELVGDRAVPVRCRLPSDYQLAH